jgi:hypothetical protein
MSQLSEQKREEKMERVQEALSAQDRYRAKVEESRVKELASEAEINSRRDKKKDELKQEEENRVLGEIDETTRMKMDPDFIRLADFLELNSIDFEEGLPKIAYLLKETEKEADSEDILDIIGYLKKIKNSYGFHEVGLTGLSKLYTYIRLEADERRISKEKALLKEK